MSENISTPPALDESLYNFTEEERTFFKQQTGISDDEELKAHICRVQAEAYEVRIAELFETSSFITAFMTEFIYNDKNRFILTLASVSSVSQSESLEAPVVMDINSPISIPQDQATSVSNLISGFAGDGQIPQGSDIFGHRQLQ
jgi:hypothetical protein